MATRFATHFYSCIHGHHSHRSEQEARVCEAAHRWALQKRLAARPELRVAELIDGLCKIVLKGNQ